MDGQVFQRAIDDPDVELAFYDLSCSRDPVREAREIASSIQRTPMPLTGPLFKFALFRTRPDEFYLFACCHHIAIDGLGMALVSHRIATVYSAIVSGAPIPAAFFGSLQDLVDCELEYEASTDYLDDQAYWSRIFPRKADRIIGCPKLRVSVIRIGLLRRLDWTRRSWAESKSYPKRWASSIIGDHRGVCAFGAWVVR